MHTQNCRNPDALGDLTAYAKNRFAAARTDVTASCMPVAEAAFIISRHDSLILLRRYLLANH